MTHPAAATNVWTEEDLDRALEALWTVSASDGHAPSNTQSKRTTERNPPTVGLSRRRWPLPLAAAALVAVSATTIALVVASHRPATITGPDPASALAAVTAPVPPFQCQDRTANPAVAVPGAGTTADPVQAGLQGQTLCMTFPRASQFHGGSAVTDPQTGPIRYLLQTGGSDGWYVIVGVEPTVDFAQFVPTDPLSPAVTVHQAAQLQSLLLFGLTPKVPGRLIISSNSAVVADIAVAPAGSAPHTSGVPATAGGSTTAVPCASAGPLIDPTPVPVNGPHRVGVSVQTSWDTNSTPGKPFFCTRIAGDGPATATGWVEPPQPGAVMSIAGTLTTQAGRYLVAATTPVATTIRLDFADGSNQQFDTAELATDSTGHRVLITSLTTSQIPTTATALDADGHQIGTPMQITAFRQTPPATTK